MQTRRLLALAAPVCAAALALGVGIGVAWHRPPSRRALRAEWRRLAGRRARFVDDVVAERFLRGNVHTHSRASDGTVTTEAMIDWYKGHGYAFLAMTEHNLRLDPASFAAEAGPDMALVAGEEVTNSVRGLPLHVNSLCASATVGGDVDFERADLGLRAVIAAIRERGGVPLVNHPNFHWALTADDVARGASGRYLFEIWSGHPNVSPAGNASHPSAEQIWDDLLERGADAVPAAVDDAHNLEGDGSGGDALPGRAWIATFGDERTPDAVCAALAAGRLYASSGPELSRIAVHDRVFEVDAADPRAAIAFVGERGEILASAGARGRYELGGGEAWVRARITGEGGGRAWTAAYRVEAK